MPKRVAVLGGGGFIGGHLAKRLKSQGDWVRVVDLKFHSYFDINEICDEFLIGDLAYPAFASEVLSGSFDEVYQLAADMGGAEYLFSGLNDANVISNSALINIHVAKAAVKHGVKKLFFSSSACVYPEFNQIDPLNPNCEEDSAYPAQPDSEYGWEKLFSERVYLAFRKNYGLNIRIARFHNIFGPFGTWSGGKEKAPAAMLRKAIECEEGGEIEVWGDGSQTRSFLFIEDCLFAIQALMEADFSDPINIGSENLISINSMAEIAVRISGKNIRIKNLRGKEFENKYGFPCPIGVMGRNSHNKLFEEKTGSKIQSDLESGLKETYHWIKSQFEQTK
ncbi:MAG: NAD-dependent epimerase/dehydratase family protein [Algoriphagus sp.]|uniref:NAD-dependent epimerase/dehydratase family protein n=1 Tax=Algoriphagus sp. TaxID=1872435 RepID=UPI0026142EDB|nr:NAD-dependent epimerase/dehydratase family protein [Algoriphagus sp.]MDG1277626.1 NAD-dependent epimerase/dehydratase family protein [Algoriphagus sp.]